jgi:uncharacterized protein YjiS (DUF1127 family)
VRCDHVADLLPGFDDGAPVQRRARRHVEQCLRCQAELVRYRRQRRALASLRAEVVRPPDDLLDDLVVDVDTLRSIGRERRRAAYVGGLAAATAAGVGGVLVLATRSRRVAG